MYVYNVLTIFKIITKIRKQKQEDKIETAYLQMIRAVSLDTAISSLGPHSPPEEGWPRSLQSNFAALLSLDSAPADSTCPKYSKHMCMNTVVYIISVMPKQQDTASV